MRRKKRGFVLVVVIGLIMLTIAGMVAYLYLNTDMLKPSKTLFFKYLGQNVENMNYVLSGIATTELDTLLNENKYLSYESIKVNNTENIESMTEKATKANYVVKFKYGVNKYAMNGNSTMTLSDVLKAINIKGEPEEVKVSNSNLVSVFKKYGKYY